MQNLLKYLTFLRTNIEHLSPKQRNTTLKGSNYEKQGITLKLSCNTQKHSKYSQSISRHFLIEGLLLTKLVNLIKRSKTIAKRLILMIRILMLITTEGYRMIEKEILSEQFRALRKQSSLNQTKRIFTITEGLLFEN